MYSETELKSMKLPELKELGQSLNIPKARYLNKASLVEAITGLNSSSSSKAEEKISQEPRPKRERVAKAPSNQEGKDHTDHKGRSDNHPPQPKNSGQKNHENQENKQNQPQR